MDNLLWENFAGHSLTDFYLQKCIAVLTSLCLFLSSDITTMFFPNLFSCQRGSVLAPFCAVSFALSERLYCCHFVHFLFFSFTTFAITRVDYDLLKPFGIPWFWQLMSNISASVVLTDVKWQPLPCSCSVSLSPSTGLTVCTLFS